MSSRHYPQAPLLGAAVAIWRGDHILLAKRTAGPSIGTWAMPGGLVEIGETVTQAAIREVKEETALDIVDPLFNRLHEIISLDEDDFVERHYVLAMFVARSDAGEAIAGDDAGAVAWFELEDLKGLHLTEHTITFAHESRKLLAALG
ncbi:NUDIX hydrolase [Pseudahrensia aquimaris]|uniref:NUDIX hydrolase n=1 Tax=Pseudahrensia aquimaris TaxID=744461 RepID=A0ABW3FDF7_9HYPH